MLSAPSGSSALGNPGKGVIGAVGVKSFDTLSEGDLVRLKTARVLFGHQSTGKHLVESASHLGFGFQKIQATGVPLLTGGLREAPIPDLEDPHLKIASFGKLVDDGRLGEETDAAGIQLAHVDVGRPDLAKGLMEAYAAKMDQLRASYPQLRLFHVAPLPTTNDAEANKARSEFGEWLKRTYGTREVVLDLAHVASEGPDGKTCYHEGRRALCAAYAADDGRLNTEGSRRCAKALLYAIARVLGAP